ncbi:MAG TPA: prepilin-type N-terminal cleavage/methylation domain-containing protein [Verrucomicrobiae bacterium]|nr:prepilin-type N-terminal cleavage/methylation domain-containing protein [Verrucomicrobiae bacterium]
MFQDLKYNDFQKRCNQPLIQEWGLIIRRARADAFTLIELLVVIAIIAILASILLPVLAAAQARALQAQCINNTKELQTGWELYAGDSQDYMVPNSPYGYADNQSWCPNAGPWNTQTKMDWSNVYGNTNLAAFTNTILAPYMSGQLGVYRCPADVWPSKNGTRVRDYSMQGQVGNLYCWSTTLNNNPNGIPYIKLTQLRSAPGPAETIVFLEEHPNSLLGNQVFDGYLEVHSTDGTCPDVPGSNHKGWLCGMSFADGHSEMHKWIKPGNGNPTAGTINTLQIPVVPNGNTISSASAPVTPGTISPDWFYFTSHCSAVNPTPGKLP